MIETITKAELVASIAHLQDNAELVVGADYVGRVNAVQVIGFEMQPEASDINRAVEDLGDILSMPGFLC